MRVFAHSVLFLLNNWLVGNWFPLTFLIYDVLFQTTGDKKLYMLKPSTPVDLLVIVVCVETLVATLLSK